MTVCTYRQNMQQKTQPVKMCMIWVPWR